MCGRFYLTASAEEIRQQFGCVNTIDWQPRYNIAPTQVAPMIIYAPTQSSPQEDSGRFLETARWGLIPSWAKDEKIGQRLINARAETLTERPAFRQALRHRRCLIPASGFYEWHRSDHGNQPYAIRRRDGELMALAGLWERWRQPQTGEMVISFIIITVEANRTIRQLHRRMPAILEDQWWDTWLDPDFEAPQTLLNPNDDDVLSFYPIITYVNNPRHDDPRCLAPLNRTDSLFV